MARERDEVLFQEDLGFFMKKKMRKLGLGLILFTIPPIALYCMFWYLIEWSSLFEKQTGAIMIFLIASPGVGLFFIVKALFMRRMRIYGDRIPNPSLRGKWFIPVRDIELVAVKFSDEEPLAVELYMKNNSTSTRDKHFKLGEFIESDRTEMIKVFNKMRINTGIR